MTENQNGNNSSPKDSLKRFTDLLDEYVYSIGLPIKKNTEVDDILTLTAQEMSAMTALQCGEAAFLIFQYAAYIQSEYNRNVVRLMWAEEQISSLLGKYGDQYGDSYTKYDIRRARLCSGDDAAKIINQIRIHASARCEELKDISNKLTMMGRALLEYQGAKSRH